MSWALAGFAMVGGGLGTGAFFAGAAFAGLGSAALGGALAAFAATAGWLATPAAISSRSRLATGASTVLDADLTNSPMSFNLARTVLLWTPSSFASSCTRALPATALLNPRSRGQDPRRPHSST
jgi:hypothetical protein